MSHLFLRCELTIAFLAFMVLLGGAMHSDTIGEDFILRHDRAAHVAGAAAVFLLFLASVNLLFWVPYAIWNY